VNSENQCHCTYLHGYNIAVELGFTAQNQRVDG
jgi:hypothetical protein